MSQREAAAITDTEKLAMAVLLFHRGGEWSPSDGELWRLYTGYGDATTKVLCDLARRVRSQEEKRNAV